MSPTLNYKNIVIFFCSNLFQLGACDPWQFGPVQVGIIPCKHSEFGSFCRDVADFWDDPQILVTCRVEGWKCFHYYRWNAKWWVKLYGSWMFTPFSSAANQVLIKSYFARLTYKMIDVYSIHYALSSFECIPRILQVLNNLNVTHVYAFWTIAHLFRWSFIKIYRLKHIHSVLFICIFVLVKRDNDLKTKWSIIKYLCFLINMIRNMFAAFEAVRPNLFLEQKLDEENLAHEVSLNRPCP